MDVVNGVVQKSSEAGESLVVPAGKEVSGKMGLLKIVPRCGEKSVKDRSWAYLKLSGVEHLIFVWKV